MRELDARAGCESWMRELDARAGCESWMREQVSQTALHGGSGGFLPLWVGVSECLVRQLLLAPPCGAVPSAIHNQILSAHWAVSRWFILRSAIINPS